MKTKITLCFLLSAFCFTASAQFRYAKYTYPTTTNNTTTISSNTTLTINTAYDVGASKAVDLVLSFSLVGIGTNMIPPAPNCTNLVVARFEKSKDGIHFTNAFTLSCYANTNLPVWNFTNVDVSQDAWVKLISISNANWAKVTNPAVFIGSKTGL